MPFVGCRELRPSDKLRLIGPDMAEIDGIIFDLGGVLIDWNPKHLYRKVFGENEDRLNYFLNEICPLEWNERQDAGRPLGVATSEKVLEYPEWEHEIRAYYDRWIEMIGGAIPGTAQIVDELAANGVRLFALSNWSLETYPLIGGEYPVLKRFERIILSAEYGYAKPDLRLFQIALREVDLPIQKLLFVDDNIRNVLAAQQIGLKSIHFTSSASLRTILFEAGLVQCPEARGV
jgi:HAD superfamily hydrolase (TIGR01509 family)